MRVSIPFPTFPLPNLEIRIDGNFILREIVLDMVEKKIEAPWIKRTNSIIQFTEKIEENFRDG